MYGTIVLCSKNQCIVQRLFTNIVLVIALICPSECFQNYFKIFNFIVYEIYQDRLLDESIIDQFFYYPKNLQH